MAVWWLEGNYYRWSASSKKTRASLQQKYERTQWILDLPLGEGLCQVSKHFTCCSQLTLIFIFAINILCILHKMKIVTVRDNAETRAVQDKLQNKKKIEFREIWKILNTIHTRRKWAIISILNSSEFILSSRNKANLFSMNFASNSKLDDRGILLTRLTRLSQIRKSFYTDQKLCVYKGY